MGEHDPPVLESWGTELEIAAGPRGTMLRYRDRDRSVASLLNHATPWAAREHLVQGARRATYGDFLSLVAGKAEALKRDGLKLGDRVLLLGWNSIDWVVGFWAVLAAGGTVALGNAWWGPEELSHAVRLLDPALVLADEANAAKIGDRARVAPLAAVEAATPPGDWTVPGDENATAVVVFTSGTTGLPKAVALSHGALIAGLQTLLHGTGQLPARRSTFPPDIALWSSPLFHVGGVQALVKALIGGGTFVFTKGRFAPDEVLALIASEKVHRWAGVPTMFSRVMNHPDAARVDLTSLKSLNVGGAPVPNELMDRIRKFAPALKTRVSTGYGLTEAGGALTVAPGRMAAAHPGSSGAPLPCVEIAIRQPDPSGEGEILVRSPTLMTGYLGEAGSGPIDSDGWLHTGDLGRMTDGRLTITGRSKDLIIRGGENIAPAMIEAAILALPGVQDVAVLGLPDPELGEIVAAAVVTGGEGRLTQADMAAHLTGRIASFAVPARWWLRDTPLPMNDVGKVDKKKLRAEWPAG